MEMLEKEIEVLSRAMFSTSFPCNPLPFLNVLHEGVKKYGTWWIKTDVAKKILYVIIAQAYGQSFKLESLDEYERLLRSTK